MWGQIEGVSKIEIARKAMNDLLKDCEDKKDIQLALRVYGHLNKQCDNSVLEIPMGIDNHSAIAEKINSIKPLGKTPIAYSLVESVNDFNPNLSGEKVIILITDGIESCDGNTCEASLKLKEAGIITKIHVVGFGMNKEELLSLNCIAEPFGGKVIGAANTKGLIEAFKEITKEVSTEKNLQVIGLDENNKSVYMYIDIYQNNKKLESDEGTTPLFILEEGVYDIYAKSSATGITIEKNNIKIEKGKKTKVKLMFSEATLKLKTVDSNNDPLYATYSIYKKGTKNKVSIAEGRDFQKAVVPPMIYDIEIYEYDTGLVQWERNVEIKPGETLEKVFRFEMGTMRLKTVDSNNDPLYATYSIYKKGTKDKVRIAEGRNFQKAVVLPGIYDIEIYEYDSGLIQWKRNIEIKAGETLEKTFNFRMAK